MRLRSLLLLSFVLIHQAPAHAADWPPMMDASNTISHSLDGRAIERFTHGPREAWGYPEAASGE